MYRFTVSSGFAPFSIYALYAPVAVPVHTMWSLTNSKTSKTSLSNTLGFLAISSSIAFLYSIKNSLNSSTLVSAVRNGYLSPEANLITGAFGCCSLVYGFIIYIDPPLVTSWLYQLSIAILGTVITFLPGLKSTVLIQLAKLPSCWAKANFGIGLLESAST